MAQNTILYAGFGYTAQALAKQLDQSTWRIIATTRNRASLDDIAACGAEPVLWTDGIDTAIASATHLLISAPPGEDGCPVLNAVKRALACDRLTWIGYLSTNGVYGDHQGAWVDETSQLRGTSLRSRRRIQAEADWRDFADENNKALIIFRLPGIYGPGRSAIDTVRAGKAKRIYKEGQVFSRMHVDDIAAAVHAGLQRCTSSNIFNLADDEPAPPQDVISYACELLGVDPPPLVPIDEADLSEMARSFYADSKQVSNVKMKQELLARLKFPNYRIGLESILNNIE